MYHFLINFISFRRKTSTKNSTLFFFLPCSFLYIQPVLSHMPVTQRPKIPKINPRSISIFRNRSMAEHSLMKQHENYLLSRLLKWHKLNVIKQQTPVTARLKRNLEQSTVQVLIFHRFYSQSRAILENDIVSQDSNKRQSIHKYGFKLLKI